MSSKRRIRDFQRCVRNIKSFSDNQAMINRWDEDRLSWVEILIRPSGGFYEGGTFKFKVYFESDSPKSPPRVDCLTPIYHPNIDTTCDDYNVCLNLFDEWDDRFTLEDVIQGLLFLLYNPNVEDPLSPYFAHDMSEEMLGEQIRQSLQGGNLDGATEDFPENNQTAIFDETELTKGIKFILERASRMMVTEVDDKEQALKEEHEDINEPYETNNNSQESEYYSPRCNVIIQTESSYEKYYLLGAVSDASQNFNRTFSKWTRYIPRSFIPTQSDILTEILLMSIASFTR